MDRGAAPIGANKLRGEPTDDKAPFDGLDRTVEGSRKIDRSARGNENRKPNRRLARPAGLINGSTRFDEESYSDVVNGWIAPTRERNRSGCIVEKLCEGNIDASHGVSC
jgi:hypothetical protein